MQTVCETKVILKHYYACVSGPMPQVRHTILWTEGWLSLFPCDSGSDCASSLPAWEFEDLIVTFYALFIFSFLYLKAGRVSLWSWSLLSFHSSRFHFSDLGGFSFREYRILNILFNQHWRMYETKIYLFHNTTRCIAIDFQ